MFRIEKATLGRGVLGQGYFVNTVGQQGTEKFIAKHVKEKEIEKEYKTLKKYYQLKLF